MLARKSLLTSHRFLLVLALSGSWQVTNVTRRRSCSAHYFLRFALPARLPLFCSTGSAQNLQPSVRPVPERVPSCDRARWPAPWRFPVDTRPAEVTSPSCRLSSSWKLRRRKGRQSHQLGALLALTASELSGRPALSTPAERSVRYQTLTTTSDSAGAETSLQVSEIASLLKISKRSLRIEEWSVWRHVRGDADRRSRPSRGAACFNCRLFHCVIIMLKSAHARIFSVPPTSTKVGAQPHRPDAAGLAPSQPRHTVCTLVNVR